MLKYKLGAEYLTNPGTVSSAILALQFQDFVRDIR